LLNETALGLWLDISMPPFAISDPHRRFRAILIAGFAALIGVVGLMVFL
jgi:hypothetical protein